MKKYITYIFVSFFIIPIYGQEDLWDVIRENSNFQYSADRSEIQKALNIYQNNQYLVDRLSKNGQRYLYHMVDETLKRDMPVELALLPFVESQFDPYAQSPAGASGIWQFILSTAREQGLKRNWWYDGRRDIIASTNSALNYLDSMYKKTNDWMLAIASFNVGPARIQREVKKNKKQGKETDFWSLKLPKETSKYLPRLLALLEVIKNPEDYNVDFPFLPNRPYFRVIDIPSQVDLMQVANISGLSIEAVYELNPGFNQWATDPNGPFYLLLPIGIADRFEIKLKSMSEEELVKWDRYIVVKGDTLISISKKYMISQALLKEINNLDDDLIFENEELTVPRGPEWLKDYLNKPDIYFVSKGDTLWSIAKKYGVQVSDLIVWNDLSTERYLQINQQINIYPKYFVPKKKKKVNLNDLTYPVKRGDTISKIAKKFGVTGDMLVQWNELENPEVIYPGQVLDIKFSDLKN
jgi:membrane-bound lytic murein transglycosylase D